MAQGGEDSLRTRTALVFVGPLLVLAVLGGVAWLGIRFISAAICSDYNSISNDVCDRWHYDPPDREDFPQLDGWNVEYHRLSCGSGGCPIRVYVLGALEGTDDAADEWARDLDAMSWLVHSRRDNLGNRYWVARKADFQMLIQTPDKLSDVPNRLKSPRYVEVHFSLRSEAAGIYD